MSQQRLWLAFAIVAGIGLGIQLAWPADWTDRPETTFDTAPRGHAGVLALLERFDSVRGRWLSGLTMPPVEEPIWWIAPDDACDPGDEAPQDDRPLATPFEIVVRPWVESGGTAVVWLSHPPLEDPDAEDEAEAPGTPAAPDSTAKDESAPDEPDSDAVREDWAESFAEARAALRNGDSRPCAGILGFPLPPRHLAGLEGGEPPVEGRDSPIVFTIRRTASAPATRGDGSRRLLPGPTLGFFDGDPESLAKLGWRSLWIEADDATPLALERRIGEGRLVVIADARIVTNDRLAVGDSAPFVFDWVRDYGAPWLDEHAHGVVPESGTFRYLAGSPAWAAGLGMLVIGLLLVWRGNAWPPREVSELDPNAPTLAGFVDSLARLYSSTRDHARVFERYRALSLDRIRRALGLAPGTSSEIVVASLRAKAKAWPELEEAGLARLLTKDVPIPGAQDLARNAARLDDLVQVLRRGRGARSAAAAGARRNDPNDSHPRKESP